MSANTENVMCITNNFEHNKNMFFNIINKFNNVLIEQNKFDKDYILELILVLDFLVKEEVINPDDINEGITLSASEYLAGGGRGSRGSKYNPQPYKQPINKRSYNKPQTYKNPPKKTMTMPLQMPPKMPMPMPMPMIHEEEEVELKTRTSRKMNMFSWKTVLLFFALFEITKAGNIISVSQLKNAKDGFTYEQASLINSLMRNENGQCAFNTALMVANTHPYNIEDLIASVATQWSPAEIANKIDYGISDSSILQFKRGPGVLSFTDKKININTKDTPLELRIGATRVHDNAISSTKANPNDNIVMSSFGWNGHQFILYIRKTNDGVKVGFQDSNNIHKLVTANDNLLSGIKSVLKGSTPIIIAEPGFFTPTELNRFKKDVKVDDNPLKYIYNSIYISASEMSGPVELNLKFENNGVGELVKNNPLNPNGDFPLLGHSIEDLQHLIELKQLGIIATEQFRRFREKYKKANYDVDQKCIEEGGQNCDLFTLKPHQSWTTELYMKLMSYLSSSQAGGTNILKTRKKTHGKKTHGTKKRY